MFDTYWYDYEDCTDIKELIAKAIAASRTEYIWLCHRAVDYSQFNLRYLPNRHQAKMMHAWASHNNSDCFTTWLIPIENNGDTLFHKDILPILYPATGKWQWKRDPLIDYSNFNFNWFPSVWDWGYNHEFTMLGKERLSYTTLSRNSLNVKYHAANLKYDDIHYDICCVDTSTHALPVHDYKVRLITTMEESLKAALKKATRPWLWVISDVCDYSEFDFEWLPEEGEEHQIHCWPSGTCEKGDTFLIHVPSYLGEWNPSYNFNHEPLQRKRWPVIQVTDNCLAWDLNNYQRNSGIYTMYFYTGFVDYPDVCLWDKRPVVSLNRSNSTCLVPRDCIVKHELYEYPHLLRYPDYGIDALNDIIFISYDEPEADANWNKLVDKFPHAKRIHGISGMENALKAAAVASETPYFYAVFAKTVLHPTFNFNIGADYWQKPKHYIFYSENSVNGLRYGHMGIVLYNRDTVLNAPPFGEFGTDYTLSFDHEVVPIVSCYGSFNASPYHTWRTAFREAHKLREFSNTTPNIETKYRLHIWRTVANGNYADWALRGANDGVKYYEDNSDTPDLRRNTFRWEWLRNYFTELYGDVQ
jgi:hypothetical protein